MRSQHCSPEIRTTAGGNCGDDLCHAQADEESHKWDNNPSGCHDTWTSGIQSIASHLHQLSGSNVPSLPFSPKKCSNTSDHALFDVSISNSTCSIVFGGLQWSRKTRRSCESISSRVVIPACSQAEPSESHLECPLLSSPPFWEMKNEGCQLPKRIFHVTSRNQA